MINQQATAIIIASVLIAGVIALTNHWALNGDGSLRLNRWTGTVVLCAGYQAVTYELQCPPVLPNAQQPK
jgi:hypothetical protein